MEIDGFNAVVLELNRFSDAGDTGWVNFLEWDGVDEWVLLQSIPLEMNFVSDVDFDVQGGRLAIGDPFWNLEGFPSAGRVVTIERDAPNLPWQKTGTLQSPEPGAIAFFGHSVAWVGDQLLTGEPRGQETKGVTWVWERAPFTPDWNVAQVLQPASLESGSNFGYSMEGHGSELFVGASGFPSPGLFFVGAVFHYGWDSAIGQWAEVETLLPSSPESVQGFGEKVILDGDRLLIASPGYPSGSSLLVGLVTLYGRDSQGAWQETQQILPPTSSTLYFGMESSLDGGILLVKGQGRVYVYREQGGTFVAAPDIEPGQQDLGYYGESISVSGGLAMIGDYLPPVAGVQAGRVEAIHMRDLNQDLVFDACQPLGVAFCGPAVPNSTGSPSRIRGLQTGVPLLGMDLVVEDLPPGEFGYMLVSQGLGFVPGVGGSSGNLCIADPQLGRYVDRIQVVDASGVVVMGVDPASIPQASGSVMAGVGSTWNFQFWHRDVPNTSNLSDAVALVFSL